MVTKTVKIDLLQTIVMGKGNLSTELGSNLNVQFASMSIIWSRILVEVIL